MDLRPLIEKKRRGQSHAPEEIRDLVAAVVEGSAVDYQLSAWLMAVVLRGMNEAETVALTQEMARHGQRLPRHPKRRRIGKHSTGGVGDKTSFLLGPLLAAYGLQVPLMAGRGLGHTGGTIDKLSGVVGFKTALTRSEVLKILRRHGFCIFEQTSALAPADRRLYALRDASGTVASLPLIVASILSKKMIESLDGLVLDVKFGSGALFPTYPEASHAARLLLKVAAKLGLRATAVLSAMEEPLGETIGNNLEVLECLETFRGRGSHDLVELTAVLAREMAILARGRRAAPSLAELKQRLVSEELEEAFFRWLKGHGGRIEARTSLALSRRLKVWKSPASGYVAALDAKQLGLAAMALGAGRKRKGESIDPTVGLALCKKVGDRVTRGEALADVFYNEKDRLAAAWPHLHRALRIGRRKSPQRPLVKAVLKNYE
ncbi:MAG TPA: thymidine phosphorylase [bacterium]|nr:thymidine phosphorylase [bacterium]